MVGVATADLLEYLPQQERLDRPDGHGQRRPP
jgi:hypothetical protein